MFRNNKERLKLYILVVLMAASIFQVGILWSYQYYGFPISFLSPFFGKMSMNTSSVIKNATEEYFEPFKIAVTKGFPEPFRIIVKGSDWYDKLWSNGSRCLNGLLRDKKGKRLPLNQWYAAFNYETAIIYDFNACMDIDLIRWFLNIPGMPENDISGIQKIAIVPGFDMNNNTGVFILGKNNVYQYLIGDNSDLTGNIDFKKVVEDIFRHDMMNYYAVFNLGGSRLGKIDNDVLINTSGGSSKYNDFKSIKCTVPSSLHIDDPNDLTERNKLGSRILGSDTDSCDSNVDIYNAVMFKNTNNVYRLYDNGLLEYNYKSLTDGDMDKGYIEDAFIKVLEFIYWRKDLITESVDMYINSINELPEGYEFTFNYIVNDIPVFFDFKLRDDTVQNNALVVIANGRRVVSAKWIFKTFELSSEAESYNINFNHYLDKTYNVYSEMAKSKPAIDDVEIAYEIENNSGLQTIEPSWVTLTKSRNYYVVEMDKK